MTKDEQQQNLELNSQNTFSVLFWQEILFYKKLVL